MKIISKQEEILLVRQGRAIFRKHRPTVIVFTTVVGLVAATALFFALFNYGSHLQQTARTRHFKQMMTDLSRADLAFVKNYATGQAAELEDFSIDIKFKHWLRLQYLRKRALESGFIEKEFKDEEFPAELTHRGEKHKVQISLTGELPRAHLGNPDKWSIQVKVKGDDTILGMKRFGLLVPTARGDLTDWLGFRLLQYRDMIGLRVDYVTVSINGKSGGVFYLEERYDKHLLENNRFRESIIFKIEKEILPNQEGKLMADPATRAQLLMLRQMWLNVVNGSLPPEKFFDMEKMARVFAFSDLMNNQHQLSKENIRFYLNPLTNLVEPIAREFENLNRSDPSQLKMFLDKPRPYTVHYWHRMESVIGLIYNNHDFQRRYIREAQLLSSKEFLDGFLASIAPQLALMEKKVYRSWPFFKTPRQVLYDCQQKMRETLFPQTEALAANLQLVTDGRLQLSLHNLQHLPLQVAYVSRPDSTIFYPERDIIIDGKDKPARENQDVFHFLAPEGVSVSDQELPGLTVHYNLLGLPAGERSVPVYPATGSSRERQIAAIPALRSTYASAGCIQEKADGRTLFIPAGNWTISEDMVIPAGKQLEIEAGARIDLVQQAGITTFSPVLARGTAESPVLITSSDGTGAGMEVIEADGWSELRHTAVEKTARVIFFRSPVAIRASRFSANTQQEHFLRIVETECLLEEVSFTNSHGTAVDCYNCRGNMHQLSFTRTGQDAISASGPYTDLKIRKVLMNGIGAAGISATASSRVQARWIDIRQSSIGIVAKDQAEIVLDDTSIRQSHLGLHLLRENLQYGAATIQAHRLHLSEVDQAYLSEQDSHLLIDGRSAGGDSLAAGGKTRD